MTAHKVQAVKMHHHRKIPQTMMMMLSMQNIQKNNSEKESERTQRGGLKRPPLNFHP